MIRELRFKIYCRRYSDDVYRFARSLLRNESDAEDATQEVLFKLWKNLPTIERAKVRAWLLKTTKNHCFDLKKKRQPSFAAWDDEVIGEREDEGSLDPAKAMDDLAWRRAIDQALGELSENLCSVFVLYEVNGLKYHEIAEALEMPMNSVKAYLSRARAKLKEKLKGHELCLES